ncbi:MAG: alpha/beta hydrolase, partial [Myxococcales bacterium]
MHANDTSAEADPRVQPFELGRGKRHALLIHGFTGTPFEMRPLGERLAASGYHCIGVKLPGHGLDPYELERANAMDWINEAREALFRLPDDEPVFIAGMSMGALIGAIIAADHRHRVRGLAMCAPPLRLRPKRAALVELARIGPVAARYRFHPKRGSDLADEQMKAM